MPVYRGKSGEPVEEDTVLSQRRTERATRSRTRESADADGDPGDATRAAAGRDMETTGAGDRYEELTRRVTPRRRGGARGGEDEEKTRIIRRRAASQAETASESGALAEDMEDPVAGWLVVIRGPGRGKALRLGLGDNSIGRSQARVQMKFGDDRISASNHAFVTYDQQNRQWYIRHGEGKNLTYLDGNPVLQPTSLASHAQVQIGDTHLVFVPLCTGEFDWENVDGQA